MTSQFMYMLPKSQLYRLACAPIFIKQISSLSQIILWHSISLFITYSAPPVLLLIQSLFVPIHFNMSPESYPQNHRSRYMWWNTVLAFTTYGLDTCSDVNVNMILWETCCSEEIDTAREVLWQTCHEGHFPEKRNRHTTDRRTGKQAKIDDILAWITILTQIKKRPKFVVDVKGLARMPKFQIESISEIALRDRVVKVESRISGLHSTVMHHILDVEVEMASIRKSFPSANNIEIAPPSGTTPCAQDNPSSPTPFSDDSVSGAANVRESHPGNNDPVPALDLHRLDQSMHASSVDLPRPIDTSTTELDSTVVTKLNVRGVETLIGDDGKTYDLPLKVNLNQSRSRDMDGVVDTF